VSRKDAKLETLARVPLLAGLGKRELLRVGQLTEVMDLPAGRVLMRQGEWGSEMMIVIEGRARVERDGQVVGEVGPGGVVGEMALLAEGPRNATVTLLTDASLLVVGHREFHALMDEMPSVRAQVYEGLARRLIALESGSAT
jgi:CRP-like cAMP-binding protein